MDTFGKIIKAKGIQLPADCSEVLSADDQAKIKETMLYYAEKLPKVNSHLRVCLRYVQGDDFSEILAKYARPLLIKGVPSLMQDLKEFYNQPDKADRIGKCISGYLTSMELEMTLSPDKEEEEQDPTVQLWLYYFMSQHYLFLR